MPKTTFLSLVGMIMYSCNVANKNGGDDIVYVFILFWLFDYVCFITRCKVDNKPACFLFFIIFMIDTFLFIPLCIKLYSH